eukprot:m.266650 g.266650  ORF g.266650 m.266650 type:complete len:980 (-) comp16038_c0_seq5:44-2983(-)
MGTIEAELSSITEVNALPTFRDHIERHCSDVLEEILLHSDHTCHFGVDVHLGDLSESYPNHANKLVREHTRFVSVLEEAVKQAATFVYESHENREKMLWKPNLHVRLMCLNTCTELSRHLLPRSSDVGKLIAIKGTVIRVSTVKTLEYERTFSCKKCGHTWAVQADPEQHNVIPTPTRCPANPVFTGAGDAGDGPCDSTKFTLEEGPSMACRDYQEVKVQELVSQLAVGTIPRSIWVLLHDDLVESCQAGDDVTVTGTVIRRWLPLKADARSDLDIVILGNHVLVSNARNQGLAITSELRSEFSEFWQAHTLNPFEGRNKILASVCPQVYGLYVVKLAVLLVLIGGVPHRTPNGTTIRGESHMLLVGDPGTGKSQFLKYAAKLIARSVITTGIGSTSAGLTVSAVKDGGEWTLEAGALVLADGGVCCIDEFNGIREHDRGSIHEAMEQQTLSVAKAGLVCKLNTRTTVLAATNPKGQYDPEQSISVNVALASPLLSRFDLILVLLDTHNAEWDKLVSSFILEQRDLPATDPDGAVWNLEKLQAYVQCIKMKNPHLCPESEEILSVYYRMQRQADSRHSARTTIRLLESLVRLAQAHARLMFRDVVAVQDAVVAVTMMESSMQGAALLGASSPLHSAFPSDADAEYAKQEDIVLSKLGLDHLRTNGDDVGADEQGPAAGTHTNVGRPADRSSAQNGAASWAWRGRGHNSPSPTTEHPGCNEEVMPSQNDWDPIRQTKRPRKDPEPTGVALAPEKNPDSEMQDTQRTEELFSESGGYSPRDEGSLRSTKQTDSRRLEYRDDADMDEAPWQTLSRPSRPIASASPRSQKPTVSLPNSTNTANSTVTTAQTCTGSIEIPTMSSTPHISMLSNVGGSIDPSASGGMALAGAALSEPLEGVRVPPSAHAAHLVGLDDDDVEFPAFEDDTQPGAAVPFHELVKRASDENQEGDPQIGASPCSGGSSGTASRRRKRRTFEDDCDDDP